MKKIFKSANELQSSICIVIGSFNGFDAIFLKKFVFRIDTYQLFVLLPYNGAYNFLHCIVIADRDTQKKRENEVLFFICIKYSPSIISTEKCWFLLHFCTHHSLHLYLFFLYMQSFRIVKYRMNESRLLE
jgi:hypothetical protein